VRDLPGQSGAFVMAIYHLNMKALQRSKGRSSVAAVAYQSGDKLHDERQDMTFDYTRKERVIESKIITPFGNIANEHREKIWNALEKKHKHPRAVTARTVEIALPHELEIEQSKELAYEFAKKIADEYNVMVDVAIHDTGRNNNGHAHLTISACSVSKDNGLGSKVEELDPIHCARNGLPKPAEIIRPMWEQICNEGLQKNGIEARIDHRTNAERGLGIPTVHQGFGINAEIKKVYNDEIKLQNLLNQKDREAENTIILKSEHSGIEKTRPIVQPIKQPAPTTEIKKPEQPKPQSSYEPYSIQHMIITAQQLQEVAERGQPTEAYKEWKQYYNHAIDKQKPVVESMIEKRNAEHRAKYNRIGNDFRVYETTHPEMYQKPQKQLPDKPPIFGKNEYDKLKEQWENYQAGLRIRNKAIEEQTAIKRIIENSKSQHIIDHDAKTIVDTWIDKYKIRPIIDFIAKLAKQTNERPTDRSR